MKGLLAVDERDRKHLSMVLQYESVSLHNLSVDISVNKPISTWEEESRQAEAMSERFHQYAVELATPIFKEGK